MPNSRLFHEAALSAMDDEIAVVDATGRICFVNQAWINFGLFNDMPPDTDWLSYNYLQAAEPAADAGDAYATSLVKGLRAVLDQTLEAFHAEYPCHSPIRQRWRKVSIRPFVFEDQRYAILTHQDVTAYKLSQIKLEHLSLQDALTGLANRRHFDQFLHTEWLRAMRYSTSLGVMMIDIDHFKIYNDHYGHLAGDQALRRVGAALSQFASRPGDLVARFGGEEFAVVLSDTTLEKARPIAEAIRHAILSLRITHCVGEYLSVSIGLASMIPINGQNEVSLISAADEALYLAKQTGRNRVCTPID